MVFHPTCCCSVSLDWCDLFVDLEGFHLVAVARHECGLVLDIESCDRFAGGPGCGVIAQGHGRVVVEVIDAPWVGYGFVCTRSSMQPWKRQRVPADIKSSHDRLLLHAALLLTQIQLVLLPDTIELLVGLVLEETQGIA